jgi:hypothetical protein
MCAVCPNEVHTDIVYPGRVHYAFEPSRFKPEERRISIRVLSPAAAWSVRKPATPLVAEGLSGKDFLHLSIRELSP